MRYNPLFHGHPAAWDIDRHPHKGPKMPKTPNFTDLANQTAAASQKAVNTQTTANRPDQITGTGSTKWTQDPKTGKWTQTTALNDVLAGAQDSQQQSQANLSQSAEDLSSGAASNYGQPLDTSGMHDWGNADFGAVQGVQDAMMSRMAPDLLRRRQQQEAQLIAQGVGRNTGGGQNSAWDNTQMALGRDENDASMQALLKGVDVNQMLFNNANQLRKNQYGEAVDMRNMPMNEYLKTVGAAGQVGNEVAPDFVQAGRADSADYNAAGLSSYQAKMDKYNAKKAGGFGNGLMNLAQKGLSAYMGSPGFGDKVSSYIPSGSY